MPSLTIAALGYWVLMFCLRISNRVDAECSVTSPHPLLDNQYMPGDFYESDCPNANGTCVRRGKASARLHSHELTRESSSWLARRFEDTVESSQIAGKCCEPMTE